MRRFYISVVKSLLDYCISIVVLSIMSPLMLILVLKVRHEFGRQAIFCQNRLGKNGRVFTLYKFRTMTNEIDSEGHLLPDAKRITPFGQFLRNSSLDELPELVNVLRGEMSLVGPRPLLVHYNDRYTPDQAQRHMVKPGITGWAQINGRNAISWERKFELDIWYVKNISLWLDMKILFITLYKVIRREGINSYGDVTMHEFEG